MIRLYDLCHLPVKAMKQTFSLRTWKTDHKSERARGVFRHPGRPIMSWEGKPIPPELWLLGDFNKRCAWCKLRNEGPQWSRGSYPNLCYRCAQRLNERSRPISGPIYRDDDIPF